MVGSSKEIFIHLSSQPSVQIKSPSHLTTSNSLPDTSRYYNTDETRSRQTHSVNHAKRTTSLSFSSSYSWHYGACTSCTFRGRNVSCEPCIDAGTRRGLKDRVAGFWTDSMLSLSKKSKDCCRDRHTQEMKLCWFSLATWTPSLSSQGKHLWVFKPDFPIQDESTNTVVQKTQKVWICYV